MVKWGVIGAGKIASRFLESLAHHKDGEFYAIASYTESKRELYKDKGCIVYDDYMKLIDDECVDAIYIAIPHSSHYKWALEALKRHKHVLCEKPATLSSKETKELCELAKDNRVLFLEGMKSRFVPLIQKLYEMNKEGYFGTIKRIETSFCSDASYDETCYLYDKVQGGALYDVGIYNIAKIYDFVDSSIESIDGYIEFKDGIDYYDHIELTFVNGVTALIECGIDRAKEKSMIIEFEKGTLKATPFYRPEIAYFNDEIIEVPYIIDDFYTEIEEVHQCIINHQYESKRMSHKESIQCIELIERIRQSSLWLKS